MPDFIHLPKISAEDLVKPTWVCVRSEPHPEFFAEANLQRADFEVYCPRHERLISHARKTALVLRPLFPNYLFVRSASGLIGLGAVRRTPGVSALAARDLPSAVVPDAIIASLRDRENGQGKVQLGADRFFEGEAVRLAQEDFQW